MWSTELNVGTGAQNTPFWPTYWSGVDCSGFVQRMILRGRDLYSTNLNLNVDITNLIFNHTTETIGGEIGANSFITNNRTYPIALNQVRKIKRGDIIQYQSGTFRHVTIVHSARYGESMYSATYPTVRYDVIHAYGNNAYHNTFSRKVTITGNDILVPYLFGRIKLW